MNDADIVREWLALDPRADWEATPDDFAEAVAALDRLVNDHDDWEKAAKSISGARHRWQKRAEAAEAALRDAQTERDEEQ